MKKTTSNGSKLKPWTHPPVVTLRSCAKLHSTGTQTLDHNFYGDNPPQITELLTEVAIALGQKANLEKHIAIMKQETLDMQSKFAETRLRLEQEIEELKREKFDTEMELSKLKISYLEEQKTVVNQVSTLKSEIQVLNQENEIIRQDLTSQKDHFEMKININQDDLKKEADKNAELQLKINKYKSKVKSLITYIQQSQQEVKDKELKEIPTEKKIPIENNETQVNVVEDMVLSELFFKPCPLPTEIQDLFFNKSQYS